MNLEEQVPATIDALRRYRRLTNDQLRHKAGMTVSQIKAKKADGHAIRLGDLEAFARALEVPPSVLLLPEDDALRRVLEDKDDDGEGGPVTGTRTLRYPTLPFDALDLQAVA